MDLYGWLANEVDKHGEPFSTHYKVIIDAAKAIPIASLSKDNAQMVYQIALATAAAACVVGNRNGIIEKISDGAIGLTRECAVTAFDKPATSQEKLFNYALQFVGLCNLSSGLQYNPDSYIKLAIQGAALVHDYEFYLEEHHMIHERNSMGDRSRVAGSLLVRPTKAVLGGYGS